MRRRISILAGFSILLSALLTAQSTSTSGSYRIGANDVVEVRVAEEPKLDGRFTVSPGGRIDLQPLGEVEIGGLTPDAAASKLRQVLEARVLQRATVTVRMAEFHSRPIRVLGAVRNPGPLPFASGATLLEAITTAGGLNTNHASSIRVLRRADNGLSDQVEIAVEDLMVRADPTVNLPLFPGDVVNVPESVPVTVFLLGEFAGRGAQEFSDNEPVTVLSVVARVGGLTNRASKRIVIKRRNDLGVVEETVVDYKAILGGKVADVPLEPGDILLAKKSFL